MTMLIDSLKIARRVAAGAVVVLAYCLWPAIWSDSPITRAYAWIDTHQSALPTTLVDLSLYPREYKLAVMQSLPTSAKLQVWRDFLTRSAATQDVFSAEQRTFLKDFAKKLEAEDFDPTAARQDRLAALLEEANTILGERQHLLRNDAWLGATASLSEHLATLSSFRFAVAAVRVRAAEYFLGAVEASAQLQSCNCYVQGDGLYDCPGPVQWRKFCLPNIAQAPYLCQENTSGCDLFDNHPCDGMCGYNNCLDDEKPCVSGYECCSGTCGAQGCGSYSPILINLDNNGNDRLTSAAQGVWFDLGATGSPLRTAWTRGGSAIGFLTLDRNGNGTIDSGAELFGTKTVRLDGTQGPNGFEALKDLDDNHDSKVDQDDAAYTSLQLWIDQNHDGVSQPDELMSLIDAGVRAIGTSYVETRRRDQFGNGYTYLGGAQLSNGRQRRVYDVSFVTLQQP